jgi:hypothetical protein
MTHFFGNTHAKRNRRESSYAEGEVHIDRTTSPEVQPVLTGERSIAGEARRQPGHREIAELAYSYWEMRGNMDGSPWDDWFRAERELTKPGR